LPPCRLRFSTGLPAAGGKRGPAAPAGLTSLTRVAAPYLRAGCCHPQCGHRRARAGPVAPAELASLTCVAAPCHRAGGGHLRRGHKPGRRGQQHLQAPHLVRAMRRQAFVPEVFSYSAATSVCASGARRLARNAGAARGRDPKRGILGSRGFCRGGLLRGGAGVVHYTAPSHPGKRVPQAPNYYTDQKIRART